MTIIEPIPVPPELLTTATLSVYAELYRRGAAKDGHAWVKVEPVELARATGYCYRAVCKALGILVARHCLLIVRSSPRATPMFHLIPASMEREAAQ